VKSSRREGRYLLDRREIRNLLDKGAIKTIQTMQTIKWSRVTPDGAILLPASVSQRLLTDGCSVV
jgi:hypothetical protein